MIVGTAGHIDHGKTTLVRALTGIDTDRLPEEKARGITIELGFAHLDVAGRRLGIVDVPGHERFVRTMAAGAGGVDVVMLVVAADEGVMPQTREHIDVCRLLGARSGLIVLTKCDLVDDEWIELVSEDVRAAVRGTFLQDAQIHRFAAPDQGAAEVIEALGRVTERPETDRARRPLRLPVDRVFTMKGFGTVVTGTLVTGALAVGDEVTLLPSGRTSKVRGLQRHGEAVPQVQAGARTAVNLQGAGRTDTERGDVIVRGGELEATTALDAEISWLPHVEHPLKHRGRCLFLLGTSFARAQVTLSDRGALEPGAVAVAQIRLDRPVVALPGDRFILRGFSVVAGHGKTVGGGRVLLTDPRRRRKGAAADWEIPRGLAALDDEVDEGAGPQLELILRAAGPAGLDAGARIARTGLPAKRLDDAVRELLQRGAALRFDKERDAIVHADAFRSLTARAQELLASFHRDHPRQSGMPREELRSRLGEHLGVRLFHLVMRRLEADGVLCGDRDSVRMQSFSPRDDAALERLKELVRQLHREAGPTPPRARELAVQLKAQPEAVSAAVAELAAQGSLVRVRDDIYLAAEALSDLRGRLVGYLQEHGRIGTSAFKEMVGGSRKYAIPLAEHFDKERVTLRVGDERVLRGG